MILVICVMILESLPSLLYDVYGPFLDGEIWIDKFSDDGMDFDFSLYISGQVLNWNRNYEFATSFLCIGHVLIRCFALV